MPSLVVFIAVAAAFLTGAVSTKAQEAQESPEDPAPEGLQAVITTADDEQFAARIVGIADGAVQMTVAADNEQVQTAAEATRSLPLGDIARVDVGREFLTGAGSNNDLVWIGQDNHDLVQVGGASGGNGIQDLHLHAKNLRSVGLKQVTVVCRFPKQLRVWRFDTSQSPHWRLAIARADLAPEAELYLEPAAIDSFGQEFKIAYTYNDGVKTAASVVATTNTSDRRRINRRARAGSTEPPPDDQLAVDDKAADIYLADAGRLRGEIVEMNADSLVLHTGWETDIRVPLLWTRGIWFGGEAPDDAATKFRDALAAPANQDVVFVVASDKTLDSVQVSVQGLSEDKLQVRYEGQERGINRERVLGIVLAAHPPLDELANPVQIFALAGGDQLTGKWVGYAGGKLEIETPWHERMGVPGSEVSQIRVRGGKLTFLPDLEPIAVDEVPYFSRTVHWRADDGFDGQPAKLLGRTPGRVLAMHSRCVLTYALGGQYETFKATLGFDDSAAGLGRVDCRVLVDGREAFAKQDFRADLEPVPLEIPLAGAQQLSLEVDFGAGEDVGDRVLWADPRLFRAEGK